MGTIAQKVKFSANLMFSQKKPDFLRLYQLFIIISYIFYKYLLIAISTEYGSCRNLKDQYVQVKGKQTENAYCDWIMAKFCELL